MARIRTTLLRTLFALLVLCTTLGTPLLSGCKGIDFVTDSTSDSASQQLSTLPAISAFSGSSAGFPLAYGNRWAYRRVINSPSGTAYPKDSAFVEIYAVTQDTFTAREFRTFNGGKDVSDTLKFSMTLTKDSLVVLDPSTIFAHSLLRCDSSKSTQVPTPFPSTQLLKNFDRSDTTFHSVALFNSAVPTLADSCGGIRIHYSATVGIVQTRHYCAGGTWEEWILVRNGVVNK
jgi:hypothetical protein